MKNNFLTEFFNLKDKIILITGATGQLGTEMVDTFLGLESKVIAVDKLFNEENKRLNENVDYQQLDITKKEDVSLLFEKIFKKYGTVDVLINNAGVASFEPFEERTEESFDWVMDVNLKGTFFCIQKYVNELKKLKKGGKIINIASLYGVVSPDPRIYTDCGRNSAEVYGATKAGLIQMTRYFGVHLAKYGININAISPGGVFNPKSPQGEDFVKNYEYRCPQGKMADAKDMMGGIIYLSSTASSYTTGHNLIIDGGMSCW